MKERKLGAVYQQLRQSFKQANIDHGGLEAALLLEWGVGVTYQDIMTNGDWLIDEIDLKKIEDGLKRRLNGESIHRIRGWREFYGLPFHLCVDTLEPRPDSEALIELVLPPIRTLAEQQESIHLLDMGTGSGALAISLANAVPQLLVTGVDIAPGAVEIAQKNAFLNGVEARFQPLLSNWFENVTGEYDFIISNPPYIASHEIATLEKKVRDFDPIIALDGGKDGLDFYRQLAQDSHQFLKPHGKIGVEIGQGQEAQVTALFSFHDFHLIGQGDDLAGIRRALLFESGAIQRLKFAKF